MSLRFHRTIRVFPGVRLNVSSTGISVSAGVPGAHINIGPRGTSATVGIPGSGLSYRHQFGTLSTRHPNGEPAPIATLDDDAAEEPVVEALSSPDLVGLAQLINKATRARSEAEADLNASLRPRQKAWRRLNRRARAAKTEELSGRWRRRRRIFDEANTVAEHALYRKSLCRVSIDHDIGQVAEEAFGRFMSAFYPLTSVRKVWDVTASEIVDTVKTRAPASRAVTRIPVRIGSEKIDVVSGPTRPCFGNADGGDLIFFPTFCAQRSKETGLFHLINIRDIVLECAPVYFIEAEEVPSDAQVIGSAWLYSNKDGSRDMRRAGNVELPRLLYAELRFFLGNRREIYQFSDAAAAAAFADAFVSLKASLANTDESSSLPLKPFPSEIDHVDEHLPALLIDDPEESRIFLPVLMTAAVAVGLSFMLRSVSGPSPHALAAVQTSLSSTAVPIQKAVPALPTQSSTAPPVAPASSREGESSAKTLRNAYLRGGPSITSIIIRTIPQGTTLLVEGQSDQWFRVADSAGWGWMHRSSIRISPGPKDPMSAAQ